MTGTEGKFQPGDLVLLRDSKGRSYMFTLKEGDTFHSHRGTLPHDALIGHPQGTSAVTSLGMRVLGLRPSLAEYVLKMPRGAQVIYPKDLGLILMAADVAPGCTVVEAGAGSGALTMALLRAVGPSGRVISLELREDFASQARRNVETYFGGIPENWELRLGNAFDEIAPIRCDRVLLDMLEPWLAIDGAAEALATGGTILCYVATVPQIMRVVQSLEADPRFGLIETVEALIRSWHVDGLAVRPDHRMVAHTGFVITARRVEPPGAAAS
ncbi:MAG: tRNA (adenine-N1)-methyltransferase [Actinomycetota bacterium]